MDQQTKNYVITKTKQEIPVRMRCIHPPQCTENRLTQYPGNIEALQKNTAKFEKKKKCIAKK